jgi:hypothetical protein
LKNKIISLAIICAVVGVLTAAAVYAVASLAQTQITGNGTITVPIKPVYGLSVNPTTIDISGSVAANGDIYTKTFSATVTNIGTDGSNGGAPATINTVTATGVGLPDGWTVTGEASGALVVSGSESLDITITSPVLTETTVLPSFTININGN